MPRITRAAMRSHAIMEEESHFAATVPLPSTPLSGRMPLGDITSVVQEEAPNSHESDASVKAMKKAVVKSKKTKGTKKGRKKRVERDNLTPEVLEDENQSETSSAVDEACGDLLRGNSGVISPPAHDLRSDTPPSPAVQATQELLSPKMQTPYLNGGMPPVDDKPEITRKLLDEPAAENDPTIENGPVLENKPVVENEAALENESSNLLPIQDSVEAKDDSFVEKIKMRTPLKPRGRIEDSVEAIDALEDAIEKVDESLPHLRDGLDSPIKALKSKKTPAKTLSTKVKSTPKNAVDNSRKEPVASRTRATQESTPARRSTRRGAPAMTTRSAMKAPSCIIKNTPSKAATPRLASSVATNPKVAAKLRVSSITKAPFVPTKSTKPPTRSTFTLPGDAIAQKLKAQREERSKREEDEALKKKVFKARPVPARMSMVAPIVKTTAASRARLSMAQGEKVEPTLRRKPSGASIKNTGRTASINSTASNVDGPTSTTALNKRMSTLTLVNGSKKRPSSMAIAPPKSKSNPLSLTTGKPSTTAASSSSTLASAPLTTTASTKQPTTTTTKSKGKEFLNRGKLEAEDLERMKREKEEAAKKARKEASERGRQASREWAERMKMKGKEKSNSKVNGKGPGDGVKDVAV